MPGAVGKICRCRGIRWRVRGKCLLSFFAAVCTVLECVCMSVLVRHRVVLKTFRTMSTSQWAVSASVECAGKNRRSVCLSVCLSMYLSLPLSVPLSLSVCLSLFVSLFVCLSLSSPSPSPFPFDGRLIPAVLVTHQSRRSVVCFYHECYGI